MILAANSQRRGEAQGRQRQQQQRYSRRDAATASNEVPLWLKYNVIALGDKNGVRPTGERPRSMNAAEPSAGVHNEDGEFQTREEHQNRSFREHAVYSAIGMNES